MTLEMILVLVILIGALVLFVTEVFRIDVTAISVMVVIGVSGLIEPEEVLAGFSSNAVVAIVAVMILGEGLDRVGVVRQLARLIIRFAGESERRIRTVLCTAVAGVSAFVNNTGAAALFLPVTERVAATTNTDSSRLLLPLGYATLLGGTITLVGASPAILLNDLLSATSANLGVEIEPFGLFAPAPIGIALSVSGILLFYFFGRLLLPPLKEEDSPWRSMPGVAKTYGINQRVEAFVVPPTSPMAGKTVEEIELGGFGVALVAVQGPGEMVIAPHRDFVVPAGAVIGVVGAREEIDFFAVEKFLEPIKGDPFQILRDEEAAGMAEFLVRRGGDAVGKTIRQLRMRSAYGVSLLAISRRGQLLVETIREVRLEPGDILIVFGPWDQVDRLAQDPSLVALTDYPKEPPRVEKQWWAVFAFLFSLGLVLFSPLRLAIGLLVGAAIVLVTRVLTPDEAYRAVSWRTVFLLASLIPLGTALEQTGTAAWIADGVISLTAGLPLWGVQLAIAVLTTAFTLTISNAGATVLLVPLAANVALGVGANPAQFGMIVAIAASNSFILPTNQVNALMMSAGGYTVGDYVKAGSVMTAIFLVVLIVMVNVFL